MPDDYYLFIHPSHAEDFKLTPRQKWKAEHRATRMAAKGRFEPLPHLETGEVVGFRFIEHKRG